MTIAVTVIVRSVSSGVAADRQSNIASISMTKAPNDITKAERMNSQEERNRLMFVTGVTFSLEVAGASFLWN